MIFSNVVTEAFAQRIAHRLPECFSRKCDQYLNGLAWNPAGTSLDWTQIQAEVIDLADLESALDSESTLKRLEHTLLDDPITVFFYSESKPAFYAPTSWALANIDSAFLHHPGRRYIFGGHKIHDSIAIDWGHYGEYNGADTVTLAKLRKAPPSPTDSPTTSSTPEAEH